MAAWLLCDNALSFTYFTNALPTCQMACTTTCRVDIVLFRQESILYINLFIFKQFLDARIIALIFLLKWKFFSYFFVFVVVRYQIRMRLGCTFRVLEKA